MQQTAYKLIQWRQVWKALHDAQYKLVTQDEAIRLIRAAGHPRPVELLRRSIEHGYQLERYI